MTLDAAIGKNTTEGKTHMMCVEGTEGLKPLVNFPMGITPPVTHSVRRILNSDSSLGFDSFFKKITAALPFLLAARSIAVTCLLWYVIVSIVTGYLKECILVSVHLITYLDLYKPRKVIYYIVLVIVSSVDENICLTAGSVKLHLSVNGKTVSPIIIYFVLPFFRPF